MRIERLERTPEPAKIEKPIRISPPFIPPEKPDNLPKLEDKHISWITPQQK